MRLGKGRGDGTSNLDLWDGVCCASCGLRWYGFRKGMGRGGGGAEGELFPWFSLFLLFSFFFFLVTAGRGYGGDEAGGKEEGDSFHVF